MTSLFSKPQIAMPSSPGVSPGASEEAERQRLAREQETVAASKDRGRRSTIVGGMAIAEEEQRGRGLLKAKQRLGMASEFGD
jgi:hypothetical protein